MWPGHYQSREGDTWSIFIQQKGWWLWSLDKHQLTELTLKVIEFNPFKSFAYCAWSFISSETKIWFHQTSIHLFLKIPEFSFTANQTSRRPQTLCPCGPVMEGQAFCFQPKDTQAFKLIFMKHPAGDRVVSGGEQVGTGGQPSLSVLMSEGSGQVRSVCPCSAWPRGCPWSRPDCWGCLVFWVWPCRCFHLGRTSDSPRCLTQHPCPQPWLSSALRCPFLQVPLMTHLTQHLAFPIGSVVKNLPANAGDQAWSLGWQELLEEEMAGHSNVLAWRIPGMGEPSGIWSMGSQRVGHDWVTTHKHRNSYHMSGSISSSVQSLSHVWFFATPWTATRQASLSITNSRSPLKLMSIELVMPSNHLILFRPLLFPPSIFPSIRVFSNESALSIRWPKCWSFSFSISPSNEYSGLISFRMDWLDLLAILAPEQDAKTGNFIFSSPSPFQMVSCF